MTIWATLSGRGPTRRPLRTLAVVLAGVASAASVTVLVLDGAGHRPTGLAAEVPACATGVPVSPTDDLTALVNQRPAGTCFLLAAGNYQFHDIVPKDRMAFVGAGTNQVIVTGPGQENAFHGRADGVVIGQMTFRSFTGSGGTSRQEQAPIRGTRALWASNRGELATNWLVADVISEGNYASGIFLGDNWTVRNSIFRSNGVTGIGGDSLVGGLIEGNIINGNGRDAATGAASNGAGIKVTQAGTRDNPVVVRDNELYDNNNEAVWCDLGCNGMTVEDNYIHDHGSRGVMFELSSNLLVRGNTFLRSNTWTDFRGDFNAGAVTIGESANAVVENNRIDTAEAGVVIRQTKRPYPGENLTIYSGLTWVASNVTVRNNVVERVKKAGISTGSTGNGMITNPGSIVFTGNTYLNPPAGGMQFWWNNGASMSLAQWQAAGRDTAGQGSQPGSPETHVRGPRSAPATTTTTTSTSTSTTAAPTTTTLPEETTAPPATEAPTTSVPVPVPVPVETEPTPAPAPAVTEPAPTTAPPTTEAPTTTEQATTTEAPTTTEQATTTSTAAVPTTASSARARPRKLARWIVHIPDVGDFEVTVFIRPLRTDLP